MKRLFKFATIIAVWLWAAPTFAEPAMRWTPTWYASPEPIERAVELANTTLRQVVRVSIGGKSIRLRLSNAYGLTPLHLDSIHIARRRLGSAVEPGTDMPVKFGGHEGVTIAPGGYALSDPVQLDVPDDSDLAISLYVADAVQITTLHDIQRSALYAAEGNFVSAPALTDKAANIGLGQAFPWVSEVEVAGNSTSGALIAFGDSITDGYGITPDKGATWPQQLSARAHEAGITLSVVNAGVSGNRLLHNGQAPRFGDAGIARFDRDVLSQPNVRSVVVLIGINDLGHVAGPGTPEYVSADDIIDGLEQLAARAHEHGLPIYIATLTPFKGTVFPNYYSDEKEERRLTINTWIRQTRVFDGIFDFDAVLEDPHAAGHLLPAYDVGDHLHPNARGAAALADSIPLSAIDITKESK